MPDLYTTTGVLRIGKYMYVALDGKLSFTFHKTQAYSITKGVFYPSFFIMKLFDKTTEYCQCDFEAKYLDNMDFILS